MKKLLLVLTIFCMILPSCKKTTITLSVDKTEITADGVDVAKFKVIDNKNEDVTKDARIFNSETNEEIGGTTFSTTEPKTYSFYATYEDATSEKVVVKAIDDGNDDGNEEGGGNEEGEGNEDEETKPLKLTAIPTTITANGEDAVTFTVRHEGKNITNESEIYVNGNKIEGNKYTSTTAGTFKAYAKKGDLESNEITITVKETTDVQEKPIELSASPTTITANGEDAVTFTVKQDGKDITSETEIFVNENKIEGNVFTSTKAGSYKAYAKKDELKSNEIDITVEEVPVEPEKPIELTADKNSLKANGIDAITFTVTQEGNDVTSQSEIYVNDGRLNGNKFTTYTAGSYNIYAKKNGVVSNEITVTAEAVENGTTVVFAEGVTTTSGWYDVNKLIKGGGDTQMCWAASAANMIQWWQDRYVAAGNSLPAGAVTGTGTKTYDNGYTYNLALMELYRDSWTELHWGSYPDHAVIWYFEGRNVYSSFVNCSQPSNSTGGYFANIWKQILANTYNGYSNGISGEINNYYEWGNGSNLNAQERLKKFSDYVVESIDKGVTSLTISLNSNGGLLHATTLWGYEIDNATGTLTKIWLTDSDDIHQGNTSGDPTQQMLREYSVSCDSSCNKVKFTGEPYGSCWAISLYPVSGYKKN